MYRQPARVVGFKRRLVRRGGGEERRALLGARRRSQRRWQSVDGHDEDGGLDSLESVIAHDAQHRQRAVGAPATSARFQPVRGVAYAREVCRGVGVGRRGRPEARWR